LNITANQAPQRIALARPQRVRSIKIAFTRAAKGETRLAFAALGVPTRQIGRGAACDDE
jgi:alpha-L-fucosidase